jgi:TM2 domain-containing membrane protein YozV
MSLISCRECGKQISNEAAACPGCGKPTGAAPRKSKSTAAALAIFLGGLGFHKFYLNETGWGIAYLVFCWTFIPAFLGFVEGIVYLSTSEENFQKKYVYAKT